MKNVFILFLTILFIFSCGEKPKTPKSTGTPSILIFSKTNGWRHKNIETGIATFKALGKLNNFKVESTEDSLQFNTANLGKYKAVVFLSTTGDVLGTAQEADFQQYIENGGSFMGIHAAADTEYDWAWFGKLVGGYFNGHPNDPNVRKAVVECKDKSHISTKMLPERWERNDEWYNYKSLNPDVNVLLNLDETSYEGGTNGANHPIAWYHTVGKGKAFYTGGGHTKEAFAEPLFQQHLLGGLKYLLK